MRKGVLLNFLYEARLIGFHEIITGKTYDPIINLALADFINADLSGAYLSGASLYGVYLFGAKLISADLSYAYLTLASLYGADLSNADLSYAHLSSTLYLTQQQLDQVRTCKNATLPPGLTCHHNQ